MMKKTLFGLLVWLWMSQAVAVPPNVLVWNIDKPLDAAYQTVYAQLEEHRFYVVFEPDIQKNLSGMAERWGENYNRNGLEGIRSMVFCNGWYANEVSNADPDMLALCPLHITLIQDKGQTRILFSRPTAVAKGSQAEAVALELEQAVSKALDAAVAALKE